VYATVADVQALDPGAVINPNAPVTPNDVVRYLDGVGAELNGVLTGRGYSVPIPPTSVSTYLATPPGGSVALATFAASAVAPMSFEILRRLEAQGAHAQVERAWPNSPLEESAVAAWLAARNMLAAGTIDLPDASFNLTARIASATAGMA
jgi:hypothetical protein